jgi:hypothetical protein
MSDRKHETGSAGADLSNEAASAAVSADDAREPYEPPRIVKRRSVVHATLFSNMGMTATAASTVGN